MVLTRFDITRPVKGFIKVVGIDGEDLGYVGGERWNDHPAYNHWDCARVDTEPEAALFQYTPSQEYRT